MQTLQKELVVMGKKRPSAQKNYHQLANNAVFPIENEDVVHYHSKKLRQGGLRLAPTLRSNELTESTKKIA